MNGQRGTSMERAMWRPSELALLLGVLVVTSTLIVSTAAQTGAQATGFGGRGSAQLLPDPVFNNRRVDIGGPLLPDPAPPLLGSLDLPEGSNLDLVSAWLTKQNTIKVKFRQSISELQLYGSVVTGEYDTNGTFLGVFSGSVIRQLPPASLTPLVSERQAAAALARSFGLCPSVLKGARDLRTTLVLISHVQPDSLLLAYLVSFTLDWTPKRQPYAPHGFVDANNGTVLERWNGTAYQAKMVDVAAVGGNVGRLNLQVFSLKLLQTGGATCAYNSANIQVQNLFGATSGSFSPTSFPCSQASSMTAQFVNGGYSPANDVARNGEIVVNMYQTYLGVASPTGSVPIKARVRYGVQYNNAFWDGTYLNVGDGNPVFFPLTTLDIVGHELGHGFTGYYSGLQLSGQSGAINEAFSDMSGQAAVFFANQRNGFVVGDNITKAGPTGVRDMCNPPSDGSSIDSALKFTPSMDVHYSCGVYNKAFCLLARKPNWDTAKAFSLMAYANAVYWGQLTTFTSGLCGLLSAARDLQYNVEDVASAFAAVNVACRQG